MRLQHYLAATARTDAQAVRRAMAVAIAVEIPHDSTGYERFYRRVVNELQAAGTSRVGVARAPVGGRLTTAA